MEYVLCSCSTLVSLDFRGMGPGERLNLKMTFGACTSLERILIDADWILLTLSDKYVTFHNCSCLVGGNETTYSRSRISSNCMRIDIEGQAGYLTAKWYENAPPDWEGHGLELDVNLKELTLLVFEFSLDVYVSFGIKLFEYSVHLCCCVCGHAGI